MTPAIGQKGFFQNILVSLLRWWTQFYLILTVNDQVRILWEMLLLSCRSSLRVNNILSRHQVALQQRSRLIHIDCSIHKLKLVTAIVREFFYDEQRSSRPSIFFALHLLVNRNRIKSFREDFHLINQTVFKVKEEVFVDIASIGFKQINENILEVLLEIGPQNQENPILVCMPAQESGFLLCLINLLPEDIIALISCSLPLGLPSWVPQL